MSHISRTSFKDLPQELIEAIHNRLPRLPATHMRSVSTQFKKLPNKGPNTPQDAFWLGFVPPATRETPLANAVQRFVAQGPDGRLKNSTHAEIQRLAATSSVKPAHINMLISGWWSTHPFNSRSTAAFRSVYNVLRQKTHASTEATVGISNPRALAYLRSLDIPLDSHGFQYALIFGRTMEHIAGLKYRMKHLGGNHILFTVSKQIAHMLGLSHTTLPEVLILMLLKLAAIRSCWKAVCRKPDVTDHMRMLAINCLITTLLHPLTHPHAHLIRREIFKLLDDLLGSMSNTIALAPIMFTLLKPEPHGFLDRSVLFPMEFAEILKMLVKHKDSVSAMFSLQPTLASVWEHAQHQSRRMMHTVRVVATFLYVISFEHRNTPPGIDSIVHLTLPNPTPAYTPAQQHYRNDVLHALHTLHALHGRRG